MVDNNRVWRGSIPVESMTTITVVVMMPVNRSSVGQNWSRKEETGKLQNVAGDDPP